MSSLSCAVTLGSARCIGAMRHHGVNTMAELSSLSIVHAVAAAARAAMVASRVRRMALRCRDAALCRGSRGRAGPRQPRARRVDAAWGNPGWSAQEEYLRVCIDAGPEGQRADAGVWFGPVDAAAGCGGATQWLRALGARAPAANGASGRSQRGSVMLSRARGTAPLSTTTDCDGTTRRWRTLPGQFALVVCDGPPSGTLGGRYGLVPVMREHLQPGCVILLDDAGAKTSAQWRGAGRQNSGPRTNWSPARSPTSAWWSPGASDSLCSARPEGHCSATVHGSYGYSQSLRERAMSRSMKAWRIVSASAMWYSSPISSDSRITRAVRGPRCRW